jgi:tetratricopeptide (TPR) repeat protein
MSRKRRARSAPSNKPGPGSHAARPSAAAPAPRAHRRLIGRRKWAARLAMMVVVPALFLLLTELALRVAGYGYSTQFFARTEDGRAFTTNWKFGWQFMPRETATQPYPVTLPAQKQKGTRRIFILGESAAQGTPAPAFGFARILEVMLQQQFPQQRFETVNAAMRGINSHAVRFIARECAGHEPDLFIIYLGNNEAVGFFAPEPGQFNLTPHPRLIRLVQWLKSTKLAQVFVDIERRLQKETPKRDQQDMDFFRKRLLSADDPLRQAVIGNFQANLSEIVQTARGSGAKVILSTVGVNLLDFPPLGSRHRAGVTSNELSHWEAAYREGVAAESKSDFAQAISHYEKAAQIDDHFAELQFRLARCRLAGGNTEKARGHFEGARDWDALQFRSDSRINNVIRAASGETNLGRIVSVDGERAFASAATNEHHIPGRRFFYEHVHLNFDGDYLMARALLPAVVLALNLTDPPAGPIPSRQECAAALAFSNWDELGTGAAMVRLTANPPFLDQLDHGQRQARAEGEIAERTRAFMQDELKQEAIAVYRAALARRPDDWQIHLNFGNLFSDFGLFAQAVDEFAHVVKARPEFLPARLLYGQALRRAGKPAEAVAQFEEILRREPGHPGAKAALAETFKVGR